MYARQSRKLSTTIMTAISISQSRISSLKWESVITAIIKNNLNYITIFINLSYITDKFMAPNVSKLYKRGIKPISNWSKVNQISNIFLNINFSHMVYEYMIIVVMNATILIINNDVYNTNMSLTKFI